MSQVRKSRNVTSISLGDIVASTGRGVVAAGSVVGSCVVGAASATANGIRFVSALAAASREAEMLAAKRWSNSRSGGAAAPVTSQPVPGSIKPVPADIMSQVETVKSPAEGMRLIAQSGMVLTGPEAVSPLAQKLSAAGEVPIDSAEWKADLKVLTSEIVSQHNDLIKAQGLEHIKATFREIGFDHLIEVDERNQCVVASSTKGEIATVDFHRNKLSQDWTVGWDLDRFEGDECQKFSEKFEPALKKRMEFARTTKRDKPTRVPVFGKARAPRRIKVRQGN